MYQGPSHNVCDILIFEKEDRENLSIRLEDLQDVQQWRLCKVHLVKAGVCMEVSCADKHRKKTLRQAELMGRLRAAQQAMLKSNCICKFSVI